MDEIEQIRAEMERIRGHQHRQIANVVQDASVILSGRAAIRQAPWIWLAAAFAVGYVLAPARSASSRAGSAAEKGAVDRSPSAGGSSLASTALQWAAPVVLRVAQAYAAARLEDFLTQNPGKGPRNTRPNAPPAPTSREPTPRGPRTG